MICLKPVLKIPLPECPNCHTTPAPLQATDFLITGMRNLANFGCATCQNEFYGDLPAGQGLYTPVLLNKKSGAVSGGENAQWFADWLVKAYKNRSNQPLDFQVRKLSKVKDKVVVLNCLDTLYGHSLLKLFNAQHYIDNEPDFSLIVIVPPFLKWLLPDGLAEAWIVDLPLRHGTEWNDWLAGEISRRLASFLQVYLSVAFSHLHPQDFDIERFTRIAPLPLEKIAEAQKNPVITFIWREDRVWQTPAEPAGLFGKFKRRGNPVKPVTEQTGKLINLAESLRRDIPQLDFAVAGIGQPGNLPIWISDLRQLRVDLASERSWCERYAKSHLVIGVHGSNMLLPSALAGGVIELISEDRQGNFLQDILLRNGDAREMMLRYRFIPHSTAPESLAQLASTMLRYEDFRRLMSPEFCRHQPSNR